MNTSKKKIYNSKSKVERSYSEHETESNRISTYRRLIELAYRESYALLSLHEQYEKILAGIVISDDTASIVSDLYCKSRDLERQLRYTIHCFYKYSQEIPDPWIMVTGYTKIFSHFRDIRNKFDFSDL